jgi:hypothetical protein
MSVEQIRSLALSLHKRSYVSSEDGLSYAEDSKDKEARISPRIWLRFGVDNNTYKLVFTDRMPLNMSFCYRLRRLERDAKYMQYLLACLSTLGGANHLCNKPHIALILARQQEFLGYRLGSLELIIRARVFQAVNYAWLGNQSLAFAMLKQCKALAIRDGRESCLHFVVTMKWWLKQELPEIKDIMREQQNSIERENITRVTKTKDPMHMLLNYKYNKELRACV